MGQHIVSSKYKAPPSIHHKAMTVMPKTRALILCRSPIISFHSSTVETKPSTTNSKRKRKAEPIAVPRSLKKRRTRPVLCRWVLRFLSDLGTAMGSAFRLRLLFAAVGWLGSLPLLFLHRQALHSQGAPSPPFPSLGRTSLRCNSQGPRVRVVWSDLQGLSSWWGRGGGGRITPE
jgi:hypothetical protein